MLDLMNSMFNDFYRDLTAVGNMPTDIEEKDNEYLLSVDLPGVNKEDIDISFEDSYLTIKVSQKEEEKDEDKYIRHEIKSYDMSRSYYLENVDEDFIKAKLDNGVLSISIAKKAPALPEKKLIAIE